MTDKKSNDPRYLYRGESKSYIREHGKLAFPKKGEEPDALPALTMDSEAITFDCDKHKINDNKDFYNHVNRHANSTKPRNSKNYLSFTTNKEIAKRFATTEFNEPGFIFKIDLMLLTVGELRKPEKITNSDFEHEQEYGLFALHDIPAIPESVIVEEIGVTADGEVYRVIKKHN